MSTFGKTLRSQVINYYTDDDDYQDDCDDDDDDDNFGNNDIEKLLIEQLMKGSAEGESCRYNFLSTYFEFLISLFSTSYFFILY